MSSLLQFAEWLGTNPLFIIAGFVLTIVSIVLACIFYFRSKKFKLPCYAIRSFNIFKDLVSKIESQEVFGQPLQIENLTATKIAFFNAGRETIRDTDVAEPLVVHVKKGYRILGKPKVLYMKNPANKFSTTLNSDQAFALHFDYVDKDEGVVIQFFHSGKSSEDLEVRGKIKGAGEPKSIFFPALYFPLPPLPISFSYRQRRLFYAITYALVPITVLYAMFFTPGPTRISLTIRMIVSAAILVVYWGLGSYVLKKRIPKGFDVFEEEL